MSYMKEAQRVNENKKKPTLSHHSETTKYQRQREDLKINQREKTDFHEKNTIDQE